MTATDRRRSAPVQRLLLALLLLPPLLLMGACGPDREEEVEPVDTEAATAETETAAASGDTGVRATTPIEGYLDFDEQQLEAERLEDSWREAALADLEERQRALPEQGPEQEPEERPAGEADAEPMEAAAADGPPVLRLRQILARQSEGPGAAQDEPAAGSRDRSGQGSAEESGQPGGQQGADRSGSDGSGSGTYADISPDAFEGEPSLPIGGEGGGPDVLRVQWLLDQAEFSPGVIDGRWGKNAEKAVFWLQHAVGLETTGLVDERLYRALDELAGSKSPIRQITLTARDLEGPFVTIPDDYREQAELDCLCYESAKEMVAEHHHTTPELLAQLNPEVDLDDLTEGTSLWVPDVTWHGPDEPTEARPDETAAGEGEGQEAETGAGRQPLAGDVQKILISKSGRYLHALDGRGQILYHFPTVVGSGYSPSPEEDLEVTATAKRPTFHYQPKLLAEEGEDPGDKPDKILPPGPNSPVGLVWMQLSKESYGIHGTAVPETIGYASSHGCVRLTNWDALYLSDRVSAGTPVQFQEIARGERTETGEGG